MTSHPTDPRPPVPVPSSIADTHPDATLYHQRCWLNLIAETFDYQPYHIQIADQAFLPLFRVPGFGASRLVSSPFRDRGGLLAVTEGAARSALTQAIAMARDLGITLTIKQAGPLPLATEIGLHEESFWVTTRTDLTIGTQTLWDQLANNAKGPVRQARKAGVTVESCGSTEDMRIFAGLFDDSRHELGIPTFPHRFFRLIGERLVPAGLAHLLLARVDDRAIAGLLLLVHNGVAIDGYAASRPADRRRFRPNDLLLWHAIEHAASQGCHTFDFGADSPLQAGLLAFKRKWCGKHVVLPHYSWGPAKAGPADSSHPRYTLARSIFQHLPRPLFRTLSGFTARRLG